MNMGFATSNILKYLLGSIPWRRSAAPSSPAPWRHPRPPTDLPQDSAPRPRLFSACLPWKTTYNISNRSNSTMFNFGVLHRSYRTAPLRCGTLWQTRHRVIPGRPNRTARNLRRTEKIDATVHGVLNRHTNAGKCGWSVLFCSDMFYWTCATYPNEENIQSPNRWDTSHSQESKNIGSSETLLPLNWTKYIKEPICIYIYIISVDRYLVVYISKIGYCAQWVWYTEEMSAAWIICPQRYNSEQVIDFALSSFFSDLWSLHVP